MDPIFEFLLICITIYMICIFAWVVLSWIAHVRNPVLDAVRDFLNSVVNPYMRLFRGLVKPMQVGGALIDLSAIIGILVLIVLRRVIEELAAG